jgi:dolichol-phosphate mannosyltransferase
MLGLGINDATAGFRAFRSRMLQALDLGNVASHGYCFQVDMSRNVIEAGGVVAEVPITFVERVHGVSKMSGSIVKEALGRVTVWGLQKRGRQLTQLFRR